MTELTNDWFAPRDSIVQRLTATDVNARYVSSSAELQETALRSDTVTETGALVVYNGFSLAALNEVTQMAQIWQQWMVWVAVSNRQEIVGAGLDQPDGVLVGQVALALLGFAPTGLGPLEIQNSGEAFSAPGAVYYPLSFRGLSRICAPR